MFNLSSRWTNFLMSIIRLSSRFIALSAGLFLVLSLCVFAQEKEKIVWSEQEKPIVEQLRTLRKLDDVTRARTTKELALKIRQLPAVPNKLGLAGGLANLST